MSLTPTTAKVVSSGQNRVSVVAPGTSHVTLVDLRDSYLDVYVDTYDLTGSDSHRNAVVTKSGRTSVQVS